MNKPRLTASSFQKLTDAQKEAIYKECEKLRWEDARPLSAKERRQWEAFKRGDSKRRK